MPDATCRAVFGNLLEKVAVRVEEKRKLRRKLVDFQSAAQSPFDVLHPVAQRKRQFLNRRRTRLANVIPADRNRIELRRILHAKLEGINHQPHRRLGRVDVFLLRDVLLQDVVLQRAGNFLPVGALFFRNGQIHRPNYSRWRINRHRSRDVSERNLVEQHFHVRERTNRDAAFADFAF